MMLNISNMKLKFDKKFDFSNSLFNNIGLFIFQLGVLVLATAPAISIFLILISSVLGSFDRDDKFFTDKFNYPFIGAALIMIINTLFLTFYKENIFNQAGIYSTLAIYSQELSLIWIGILNWIPFFWCFWTFQKYLKTTKLRIQTSKLFIIGTLPVLISGFCQYFFGLYGPYTFLNNLIIWYQRPLDLDKGVTGIFNNQNYAGAWLCILLPICIAFLLKNYKNKFLKILIFFIFISFVYIIILTTSRGAIFSGVISILILFRFKRIKWFVITIISSILLINLLPNISIQFSDLINLFPGEINKLFSMNLQIDNFPRLEVWNRTIEFILANPFIGYGGGSFPLIYSISSGEFWGMQHTHNIILEIAFNYGIISSLLIIFTMCILLVQSGKDYFFFKQNKQKELKNNSSIFDKSWILSFFIFFLIHMFDITYFDGRISILAWILLSGMRSIIKEKAIS